MRVLFLHRHSPANSLGGIVEYLHYLPLALKALGIEVFIYHESQKNERTIQGPFYWVNGIAIYSGPFIKPRLFINHKKNNVLLEFCLAHKIDLIHAQGTYRSGFLALEVYKKLGIPYLVTSHSDIVSSHSNRMNKYSVRRRCRHILENAAIVTHLSPLMADISHQVFNTAEKSRLIGNGIDLADWRQCEDSIEKNYMVALGRLEPEKGFQVLIDAYRELVKKGERVSLVIAGTGSFESALHEQTKSLGLNLIKDFQGFSCFPEASVIFTGYVKGEIKKRLIAHSKLVLFPTQPNKWVEPFGIVQIEAMAAGKMLIAGDSVTTRYLVSLGLQAALVKADDSKVWGDQIYQALNEKNKERLRLGKINFQNADQFDWQKIATQYKEAYESALVQ
jgi:glycosyltransferase involved in cell wall biosynthesis